MPKYLAEILLVFFAECGRDIVVFQIGVEIRIESADRNRVDIMLQQLFDLFFRWTFGRVSHVSSY